MKSTEGHYVLRATDPAWPSERFVGVTPPPAPLMACGDLTLLHKPTVAIVGSRDAHLADCRCAEQIGEALARAGIAVCSGLALGIDSAALRGALAGSPQGALAVVGNGIDVRYPRSSSALQAQIARTGLLLSEYPLGTPPRKHHFPHRNRLIAALADAVVIVSARQPSGSLITATLALELGRDVCAVPGPVEDGTHAGCHHLIKAGAALVESALDVVHVLTPLLLRQQRQGVQGQLSLPPSAQPAPPLPRREQQLLARLSHSRGTAPEALATRLGLPLPQVHSLLFDLEHKGLIATEKGGFYVRVPPPQ